MLNTPPTKPATPDWTETAVFYEIYPQTFFDSNEDVIGDLPGVMAVGTRCMGSDQVEMRIEGDRLHWRAGGVSYAGIHLV